MLDACKIEGSKCLNCGQLLNGATNVSARKDSASKPTPGSLSICLYCGHLMVFADDLSLRNPNSEEMYEIAGNKLLLKMQEVRGEIMKKYKDKQQVSNLKK